MNVKIMADSTCDLSPQLLQQYHIDITPLYVGKNGKYYRDCVEISAADIFEHVAQTGELCTTAAVNVEDYLRVFSQALQTCDGIVHFTISSDMSSCYQNACIAASELENVFVIDSRNLSVGIGLLAIEASVRASEGMAAAQIAEEVSALRDKLDVSFVLDTLDYLQKGGRCSSLAALGANLLSLKPCIEVQDGKMHVGKKYRGSREKCSEKYIRERLADVSSLDLRRIVYCDSYLDDAMGERLRKLIAECAPFAEILSTKAGCTISSHCGPNCMGLLFFRK